jgi:hypothetical protein
MKILYFLLGSCIVVALVFAAASKDKAVSPADKGSEASVAKRAKGMTVQELIDGITKVLDKTDEVMNCVPGFKQEKDPDGKEYYTYKGVRLEKIDKEKLTALYNRVRQERTRLNTERINRQLETIQRAQQAANIANQAGRIPTVTQPPPQPPKAPPSPPPVPRR